MFTGLVETVGRLVRRVEAGAGHRLEIDAGPVAEGVAVGDSIAINGCCLTVVACAGSQLAFEAGAETLSRTNLGRLQAHDAVNLERSLRAGDRLGGHYVTGHVDAVGTLVRRIDDPPWAVFWFEVPRELVRQMAPKGSVTVDGVSLTLVEVGEDRFSVALIPHTLSVTRLGTLAAGDPVNIETDVLAKYVQRQMEVQLEWQRDKRSATSPIASSAPGSGR